MVLDDVAAMSKLAAKKTAGIVGDDLAVNANVVVGLEPARELPIVGKIALGSLANKFVLVPLALVLPSRVIGPLLMLGGAFLCYEGFEKIAHKFLHSKQEDDAHHQEIIKALADPAIDLVAMEKDKIKGAIRTDFILSAEIIVITLGTVAAASFGKQVAVLVGISLLMTVGVYGLVAGIVKLDDAGLYLSQRDGSAARATGRAILFAAPYLMKLLSIAGTAAMFLVGGGILTHGIAPLHHAIEQFSAAAGKAMEGTVAMMADGVIGILAGALVLALVTIGSKLFGKAKTA